MIPISCTVLPVGRTLQVLVQSLDTNAVQCSLAAALRIPVEAVELLEKVGSRFQPCLAVQLPHKLFALIRLRAGGKGGFRKQLEKKGREFSRAKQQAKKAKESEKPVPIVKPKVNVPSEKKQSISSDLDSVRNSAIQGIRIAVDEAVKDLVTK